MDRGSDFRLDRDWRDRLVDLGPDGRASLLRALNRPGAEPATLIGALYPVGEFRSLTGFLIELEHDLPTLEAVVAELRSMERRDYQREKQATCMGVGIGHPSVRLRSR
jgi:hypothetical protein